MCIRDSYDEDRFPSGSAGGMVVQDNPVYGAKALEIYLHHKMCIRDRSQDGLIWKDNMGFSGGEDEELFKAGRAFARYQGGVGVYNNFSKEMLENGVIEKDTDMGPAIVKDRNGDVWLTQTEDYWTVTAF